MNWLDIALFCLAIAGIIKGFCDGFVRQIVFFLALIAAIYLCSHIAINVREYVIQTRWFSEPVITYVSYILAFILITGVITLVGWIIHKMISVTPLSLLNQLAGAGLGLVITLLFISLTLNIMEGLDRRSNLISRETKVESRFYFYVKDIIPSIYPLDLYIFDNEEEEE
ncbi:MAG: CvpA family protein [Tannerella sp.]|jgi:membrane protein required for colicin V production|nr:CvpA family protein [Tannerella sp.]